MPETASAKVSICDSRFWLMERFTRMKTHNPRTSLRSFARQLGVSPSALSEMLSGKRPLTEKMSRRLAEKMKLSRTEKASFLRSTLASKVHKLFSEDRNLNSLTNPEFLELDLDKFKLISEWHHFALLSLAEIKGAKTEIGWIARRLGISKAQAKESFDRLVRMGLILSKPKNLERSGRPISVLTLGLDSAMRLLLTQMLERANQSLKKDEPAIRELSTITMAIDPDRIEEAREAIKRFRRELSALLEQGNRRRVYTLAIQLFPLDEITEEQQ